MVFKAQRLGEIPGCVCVCVCVCTKEGIKDWALGVCTINITIKIFKIDWVLPVCPSHLIFSFNSHRYYCSFKYILLIVLLQLSHLPPFPPLHSAHPLSPTFPPFSSCPWVILISSLASTFLILFLPSPCLFSTYHLCYLFSVPFPPLSPSPPPCW